MNIIIAIVGPTRPGMDKYFSKTQLEHGSENSDWMGCLLKTSGKAGSRYPAVGSWEKESVVLDRPSMCSSHHRSAAFEAPTDGTQQELGIRLAPESSSQPTIHP